MSKVKIQPLEAMILQSRIRIKKKTETKVWLAVVDAMDDTRLDAINEEAMSLDVQLLVFKPTGIEIEYALFNRELACWLCYHKRHRLLDSVGTYLNVALPTPPQVFEPVCYNNSTTTLAFSWIMLEIERLLFEPANHPLAGKLRVVALDKMESSDHIITQLAHCTSCQAGNLETAQFPLPPEFRVNREMIVTD